ncbi:hypothetical protein [Pedobacter alpinus]|uniref:Uncharacterized protein n=1 Tax=Pedobacter alpinus TaxID=1590643 RepID=A0ABW5TTS0_9SPHI
MLQNILNANNLINSSWQPVFIAVLSTLALTVFSMVLSTKKRNFVEPSHLAKIFNYHLKDSPSWLNIILGVILHFIVGYLFTLIHLYYYQLLKPIWYNGLFLGLANGLLGALVWYVVIKIYNDVLTVDVKLYLLQLVIAHIIFGLVILYMYKPIILSV